MNTQTKVADIDIRDAFFDEVYRIAAEDPNVIFLTADMGAFSLDRFKRDLSGQYINVGVAEQNLVSIGAGLALGGRRVFVYTIASFITQRCYEQIKIDLCGMRLPVTIIGVGGGITYSSDGPTHQAMQDVAIIRALPEITILNPSDPIMAAAAARIAYKSPSPIYIRIEKGKLPLLYDNNKDFSAGLALLKKGRDLMIITTGIMVHQALKVVAELAKHSIDAGIIDLYRIKPINEELLLAFIEQSKRIVTLEEHSIIGGIGSAISEVLVDKGKALPMKRIALADKNCSGYGDREWMHSYYGLDMNSITKAILDWQQTNIPKESSFEGGIYSQLTLEDFARLFGTTIDDIPNDCRKLIAETDFRHRILGSEERDKVLLDVLKKIDSDQLTVAGREKKVVWEKGWSENLQNFLENYDLNKLTPKYYRPSQVLRLYRNYITAYDQNFEFNFFKVFRLWLFRKYLRDAESIHEFGCGPGHNLVALAELYPEKKIHGLDWSLTSRDLVNKIAEVYKYNITGHLFDMFSPDESLEITNNSAILTIGSLEQLGHEYELFLQFILKKSPKLCIHVEPICELYNENHLLDYVAIKYHQRRGYLENYLNRLRRLEIEGKIEILKTQRMFFGSLYEDSWSFIVWRLRRDSL
ncbi:MAG: transketolase C-terminal domain-containing protein [Dehalococcoidia bacterium]